MSPLRKQRVQDERWRVVALTVALEQRGAATSLRAGATVKLAALSIDVIPDGHTVTLVLDGEMDVGSVGSVRSCLADLEGRWRRVTLDMRGVTFIDSSAIALLLQAHTTMALDFRQLELRHVDERVRRALELSGAIEFLPLPSAP
jgi:anti-anti-sigma factor